MDRRPRGLGVLRLALVAVVGGAGPTLAWNGDGHTVIEALAYRTLEGHAGLPAQTFGTHEILSFTLGIRL